MVKRERVVDTEGCSSQELVFSLEREGPRETCAPGLQVGGVSKPVKSLCTLSLESYRCLQHCHQRR